MKLPAKRFYPKELLIGNEIYQIRFVNRIGPSTAGECDGDSKVIRLQKDQTAADTFATLIHEVLHAMDEEHSLALPHHKVYALERALSDFFLQNF